MDGPLQWYQHDAFESHAFIMNVHLSGSPGIIIYLTEKVKIKNIIFYN